MDTMQILKRYGIDMKALVDCAFALYVGDDLTNRAEKRLRAKLQHLLEKNMQDANVALLIAAAAHLDKITKGVSGGPYQPSEDPEALVADELIGMSIAEYIAGKRGLFNYVRYDKAKPGILSKLPPFMDDAVGALVAASMTRLFEE
jgi:alpha-ribazole phosphatase CobZ